MTLALNIGCGAYPLPPPYRNIDSRPGPGVDEVARVPPLAYADGSVDAIYAGHVLEHLPPWDVAVFLAECYRVLRPGGTLTVVVPDERKARLGLLSTRLGLEQYSAIVGGALPEPTTWTPARFLRLVAGEDEDDMPHWTLWNTHRLYQALTRAGFVLNLDYAWHRDERVADRSICAYWQTGAQGVRP
jgi:predicted SAM-dependent methyltransferase